MCGNKNYIRTFKNLLRLYSNKDVIPTLEATQKMVDFHHKRGIDLLRLGCTLPTLANICLHKSTIAKFYPITVSDEDFLGKICDVMVVGPSIVFTQKALEGESLTRISTNLCKILVGNDASQLYAFFMCQAMLTGLYT